MRKMALTQKVKLTMTNFIIKKLPYDLSSHAGLAFISVGAWIPRCWSGRLTALIKDGPPACPTSSTPNAAIIFRR